MTGLVSNIQRYSIHDGPGIRTTIFLKGCPLSCWWCHNPENINPKRQQMFYEERCRKCGNCHTICNYNAREEIGEEMTVAGLIKEIMKDEPFYEQSGGGVTFSGGEPFMQPKFLLDSLKACKDKYIHTAVDTSGYMPWEHLEPALDYIDLFLYDLKLMDTHKHKKYTGVENQLILDNLKKLSTNNKQIHISIPLISDINVDDENIDKAIKFLSKLNIQQVRLLPYHKMGMEKYKRLGLEYNLTGEEKPTKYTMTTIANKFISNNFNVKIGG